MRSEATCRARSGVDMEGCPRGAAAVDIRPIDFSTNDLSELSSILSERDARRLVECRAAVDDGDTFILVADRRGSPVGLAIVDVRSRPGMSACADDEGMRYLQGDNAYLENIEVRREWRRQGIGSRLLEVVQQEALARGKRLLWLHADERNVSAHQFYERNGWVHEKTVYPAWVHGRPTRVYKKEL